jgi:thiol-disulfide isomerase/thioredoxin
VNRRTVFLLAALMSLSARAADAPTRAFRPGSFAGLLEARRGEPFLLVLWSLACPPCLREFEMLGQLRKVHPRFPLVLIATDDIADSEPVMEVLRRYGLELEEAWIFADQDAARLRYEIDPGWHGDMPRAYFYQPNHDREAVSGSLERARVEAWVGQIMHRE